MARPKKTEEKPKDSASLQISVEDFVRTRDAVSSCPFHPPSFHSLPPTRDDHNNIITMGSSQLTVIFTNKPVAMPQSDIHMTRAQRDQAFRSIVLLTVALKSVEDVVLASIDIAQHVPDRVPNALTFFPQVVTGLSTLQSAVQELSRAYINHTNTVIGKGPGAQSDILNLNHLGGESLFGNRAMTPVPNVEAGESKKRKRAPHDKNAPKRPVTPYFLYMQTARSLIANEMPPGHTAKQVADEGTRRWLSMADEEKKRWGYKYGVNFARYKEKSKAYKEGRPIPDISDEDAKKLYDELIRSGKVKGEVPLDPGDDEGHGEEDEDSNDESESSSSEEEPEPEPEPVKAPSPPKSSRASKRQKGAALEKKSSPTKLAAAEEVESVSTPIVEVARRSPELEKKKKGLKKKDVGEPKLESVIASTSSPPKLVTQDSQQKSKKSRKKRKSEAVDE